METPGIDASEQEVAAWQAAYVAEVQRLRDRTLALRAWIGDGHAACQYGSCPAVGTVLRAIEAISKPDLIDHVVLHRAVDLANAHLDGKSEAKSSIVEVHLHLPVAK